MLFEGLAETATRRPRPSWPPATASASSRATTTARSGPWPVSSRRRWGFVRAARRGARRHLVAPSTRSGKVLRYGAYGPEVIDRLHWMNSVLGPLLQQAIRKAGPIDIKAIVAQMLQMGDEGHNRNRAGSPAQLRELLPSSSRRTGRPTTSPRRCGFGANEHFFLNLGMPACKLATMAACCNPRARRWSPIRPATAPTWHPRLRHRRRVVHRAGQHAGGPVPRLLRPEGRRPGHRGLSHHRDRRHRRALPRLLLPRS